VTNPSKDRWIQLSVARRMVIDYMWAASGVARMAVRRGVAFGEVIDIRRRLSNPPSWTAIFVKAFAIVAAEIPELRRAYMKWPWPHLHEYGESTVFVSHECKIDGETGVLPLRFRKPDGILLRQLSDMIRHAANAPIEDSKFYRTLIALMRLPLLVRRFLLTLCLNIPRMRRHAFGTCHISSIARWQSEFGATLTPLPYLLMTYGPADSEGKVQVELILDHRIFDGAVASRALSRLDQVLNSVILEELRELASHETTRVEREGLPASLQPATG
jgi:hypothetical protein